MTQFIHLRCHSPYSIGEGSIKLDTIIDNCHQMNYPAVGICDTNNLFAAREVSLKLVKSGIQPIIGYQIMIRYKNYCGHLVLLAKNEIGYKNMLLMHDITYQNALNEDISISLEQLLSHHDGIICLSGGCDGILNCLINDQQIIDYEELTQTLHHQFGEDFYLELNRFYTILDNEQEDILLTLAQQFNIPIVATNNVTFNTKDDYEIAQVLYCIKSSISLNELDALTIKKHSYFKSADEMVTLFADLPEAIENTIKIAKKCCFFVEQKDLALPLFSDNEEKELKEQSYSGLKQRFNNEVVNYIEASEQEQQYEIYQQRLTYELDIIISMGFTGYFLIVSDFIKWSKSCDIPVGPGRGSGAGSLVAWCLLITDIDPLRFGLLFERFLNPERVSMPDFDIDFCQNRRLEVINYIKQKYGHARVAHIITFGTFQAKAAIKDVARVIGINYFKIDQITKKIPNVAPSNNYTLVDIIQEDNIKIEIDNDYQIAKVFNIATKVEGLLRNISTHAAGIVIAKQPLNELVPLYYEQENSLPSVGFSMKYIEDASLVKFDFLALKTLTVIHDTITRINNTKLDILKIPHYDTNIAQLIGQGNTLGIFQLESTGMTEVVKQLLPDKIEDIIAIISLYRPGPMENIPMYIENKFNKTKIQYIHAKLESLLAETFGIMIYQEQVMQAAQLIAGYSLGSADLLRRAMGKKNPQEMAKQKDSFIQGAKKYNNIDANLAGRIFDQIEKFAGYGFNKSHAAAYALISWQTAYLKTYYPVEFFAAIMSADIDQLEKHISYVQEIKKYNIEILPPSINAPVLRFEVEYYDDNKTIRYPISALKGIGYNLAEVIYNDFQQHGKFINVINFLERIDAKYLNKKYLEALIKAGIFDKFHYNRRTLFENIDILLNYNKNYFNNKNGLQNNLLDLLSEDIQQNDQTLQLTIYDNWHNTEIQKIELEIVGYFLSGHPLDKYQTLLNKHKITEYQELFALNYKETNLAIYLINIDYRKTKNGNLYANLKCYDLTSIFSLILYGDSYQKWIQSLNEDQCYIIGVQIKIINDENRIFINNVIELTNVNQKLSLKKNKLNNKVAEKTTMESTITYYKLLINDINDIINLPQIILHDNNIKSQVDIYIKYQDEYLIFNMHNALVIENNLSDKVRLLTKS